MGEHLTPGIYSPHDVPMARYVADDLCAVPTLSCGVARLLVGRTSAHAREEHPRLNPDYEEITSDAFDLGSACHDWLLGDGANIQWGDFPDFRSKIAKDWRETVRECDEIPMLEKHRERIERVCMRAKEQIKALPIAKDWSRAENEVTVIASVGETPYASAGGGVLCRCRPDRWADALQIVFHYKTTGADAANYAGIYTRAGFDFTAAWYRRLCGGRQIFLVQEMQPPYLLQAYEATEVSLDIVDRKVQYALDLWKACLESDLWPGYPPTIREIYPFESREDAWIERELIGETTPEAIAASIAAYKEMLA